MVLSAPAPGLVLNPLAVSRSVGWEIFEEVKCRQHGYCNNHEEDHDFTSVYGSCQFSQQIAARSSFVIMLPSMIFFRELFGTRTIRCV